MVWTHFDVQLSRSLLEVLLLPGRMALVLGHGSHRRELGKPKEKNQGRGNERATGTVGDWRST